MAPDERERERWGGQEDVNEIKMLYVTTIFFSPITYAWEGGCMLANTEDYKKMAVTREQYEEHGHTICSETFDI